ncbi:MAG: hypothetical protein ACETWM_18765 [Candidatus Lokiarchaeia archaeon]
MSKLEVRRCENCGNQFLSQHEECPNCGKTVTYESNLSGNDATIVIPLARTSTSSKKEEPAFVPSRIIEEQNLEENSESTIFLGTGFSINVVSSENIIQYEVNNIGNEFLGFVECKNTPSGLIMSVRDAKGLITDKVEGNPQYTQYTINDRYNKTIGTMQQQGVLKQSYVIESLTDNLTLITKGDPTKKQYSFVKNGQNFVNVLKTSPETYKIEIRNKVDKRIPILFSMAIDAAQRRKK